MLPRLRRREPSLQPLLRQRTTLRRQRSEHRCGRILKTPMPARRQRSELRCGRILKVPMPPRRQRSEHRCGRILKTPMPARRPRSELRCGRILKVPMPRRSRCRKYYTKNIRASVRARHALAEPKAYVVATYVTSVERSLFHDEKAKLELADAFQQYAAPTCVQSCNLC